MASSSDVLSFLLLLQNRRDILNLFVINHQDARYAIRFNVLNNEQNPAGVSTCLHNNIQLLVERVS